MYAHAMPGRGSEGIGWIMQVSDEGTTKQWAT